MDKKKILITIIVSIIASVIISLICCASIISWANGYNLSLEDFTVSELRFNKEVDTYYTSYDGEAKIYCKDNSQPYIVAVSTTLISGGNEENIGKTISGIILVENGEGEISTYDYGDTGEITQPKYEIKVLGFKTLSK